MATHAAKGRTTKGTLVRIFMACCVAALLVTPLVRAAAPNEILAGQKIDMKVLLLSADGTEPGFGAWKAELEREGVPYDTFVAYNGANRARTLTDGMLADYGADRAKYQAVILASGDLGRNLTNRNQTTSYLSALTDAEWAALARFERTFAIRQISDYTAPSPAHGLNDRQRHQPGRPHRHAHRGRQAGLPLPEGPDPGRRRRARPAERGVRLRGHAGQPRRLADARRRADAEQRLPGHLHAPGGRARGAGDDAGEQPVPEPQPGAPARDAQLGHARRLPRLPAQLPRARRRRRVPRRRQVGPGRERHELRLRERDPHERAGRRERRRLAAAHGAAAEHGLQPRRQRALRRRRRPLLAAFRASKNQFTWINHTLDHPNLDCTTEQYTRVTSSPRTRRCSTSCSGRWAPA